MLVLQQRLFGYALPQIGPRRAIDYAHVGARTLEDLKKLNADKKIKLFKAQELGLEHLNDVEKLIPRECVIFFIPPELGS